ncbi:MAG: T9SS type A sorting domain-containing protein [Salibacteraceae bacterium]
MKKYLFSTFLLALSTMAFSQITVDSSDFGQIGDEVLYVFESNIAGLTAKPASSTAQVFDYSSLSFSSTDNYYFLDPVGSSGASDFPNSNILLSSGGGISLNYINKSVNTLELDGVYGDPYGIGSVSSLNFTPNVTLLNFPAGYGDMLNAEQNIDTTLLDTVTGLFDSLRLVSKTEIISSIDAFGTLQLPNMTEDVLRKYDVEVRSDTVFGLLFGSWQNVQQSTTTRYFYRFLAKNKAYYVLEAESDDSGNIKSAQFQVGTSLFAGVKSIQNISCFGLTDGEAEVIAVGGIPPYSYSWSDGQTGSVATGLDNGAISVVVTDAMSDSYTVSMVITEPDLFEVVSSQIGADHGLDDGFIEIDVNGGTPSFTYLWSNGETSKNLSDLTFGSYSVTVTDASGCLANNTFTVDDITSVPIIPQQSPIQVYPNPVIDFFVIDTPSEWSAKLVSIDGKILKTYIGFGKSTMQVPARLKGMFMLIITTETGTFQTKIHIQ